MINTINKRFYSNWQPSFSITKDNILRHYPFASWIILRGNLSLLRNMSALRCLPFILDTEILQIQWSNGNKSSAEGVQSYCLIISGQLQWNVCVSLDLCDGAESCWIIQISFGYNMSPFGNKSMVSVFCFIIHHSSIPLHRCI